MKDRTYEEKKIRLCKELKMCNTSGFESCTSHFP